MYPIGAITSVTDGGLTVNGSVNNTFWSVLEVDDEVVISNQTTKVDSVFNDIKFRSRT